MSGGAGLYRGFFTPTGYGTIIARAKRRGVIDGRHYYWSCRCMLTSLLCVPGKATTGQSHVSQNRPQLQSNDGNGRTPDDAEVETLVDPGGLDPHLVHTPELREEDFAGGGYEHRIEKRTTRHVITERFVKRVARELRDALRHLGIECQRSWPPRASGIHITLHSETACSAWDRIPRGGGRRSDHASKETVTELPGCSYFSSADSFAMVRGGTST